MRLDELARCGLTVPPGAGATEVTAITADSREVAPGALFFALPGSRLDGRRFVADAIARGAAAIALPEDAEPGWPVPVLVAPHPQRALAFAAAAFHPGQPEAAVGVTGTNGKTSTADFVRQICALAGHRAASLGTLGLVADGLPPEETLTTPGPVALHRILSRLHGAGITHLAMEASSHGLHQGRLDAVRLLAAGFTSFTRDHLDYHGTLDAYREAKLALFRRGMVRPGGLAVLSAALDAPTLRAAQEAAAAARLDTEVVKVRDWRPLPGGQAFSFRGQALELAIPGRFQADNALVATALARAMGVPDPWALLPRLVGVRGRMELAATLPNGAAAYVDYAHTPDALSRLLEALRPHVAPGARLHVLFGAGGDRDPGKRPLMGAAAAAGADRVWVTDDNPRSEDPAAIRRAVLQGAPGAVDAGGRAAAIARALGALGPGDVLAVAGKGHEQGQTIGGETLPFDDASVVRGLVG
ncbi:UDP-N-acetylmuramoyl-L-alanyl-D-glutamate--2,6-diaminopimelate ligase [Roseococcus sp. DSY-14]|uniref:UDP-N-acetylmuramoyl-L-alanyl-D-glutamate--2, 6-diaminopimelate ligase n=1 Tax=Roseococcus sp. DSY-14 TaxID=3369650 RepID=UPI00387B49B6